MDVSSIEQAIENLKLLKNFAIPQPEVVEGVVTSMQSQSPNIQHPFVVGKKYFIRTVTYHTIMEVKEIRGSFLVGDNLVWVADSGRFQQAIENGVLNEIEPIRNIEGGVNISTIIDYYEWTHDIPTEQK